MKSERCTFCGQSAPLLFRVGDVNRRLSDEEFPYYRCPDCGLIFLWPVPADLGSYYPKNYYSVPSTLPELEHASVGERYKMDILQRHVQSGRLLEIGSAYGSFAYLAKKAGFEVEVIEMDQDCCAFLQGTVGVRAINESDPVKGLEQAGTYDAIVLWQVIEHLPDPWSTLGALSKHLNPGGILILAAPNPEAFQFRLQGRRWPHVDAPRHLSLIPISLLRTCMKKFGVDLLDASTTDPGCRHWNEFGWQFWLGNFFSRHRLKRWASRLGTVVARIAAPIETREPRGSTYTLVFRKS